jgi:hypothetical protein
MMRHDLMRGHESIPTTYRNDLDVLAPSCGHGDVGDPIYLHPHRCHPRASLDVMYHAGRLLFECAICEAPVAAIAVAWDEFRPEAQ